MEISNLMRKHKISLGKGCLVAHLDDYGPCGWCIICCRWIRPNKFEEECFGPGNTVREVREVREMEKTKNANKI